VGKRGAFRNRGKKKSELTPAGLGFGEIVVPLLIAGGKRGIFRHGGTPALERKFYRRGRGKNGLAHKLWSFATGKRKKGGTDFDSNRVREGGREKSLSIQHAAASGFAVSWKEKRKGDHDPFSVSGYERGKKGKKKGWGLCNGIINVMPVRNQPRNPPEKGGKEERMVPLT